MHPIDTDFPYPILDFFKPTRLRNRSDFIGLQLDGQRYQGIFRGSDSHTEPKHERYVLLPSGVIRQVYSNDLGGLSIGFSGDTIYLGNFGGGVEIKFPREKQPWSFDYGQVARVRRTDGFVVWENADIPKKRRILTRT